MSELTADRIATRARIAQSRAEIRQILEPPPRAARFGDHGVLHDARDSSDFPRSRIMRMLLSGRGIGTVGAIVGGLVMTRPRLVFRLLRMLPTGAVARMLIVKAISNFRSK